MEKKGFLILGFPSVGKTTLIRNLNELGHKAVDQDEIKKCVAKLLLLPGWMQFENVESDWKQLADVTAAIMLSMTQTGVIVTYSDTLAAADRQEELNNATLLAFRRDLETTKEKMFARDGVLHPNIDSWTNDWYNKITDTVIDLSPDEYASDYIGFIETILKGKIS